MHPIQFSEFPHHTPFRNSRSAWGKATPRNFYGRPKPWTTTHGSTLRISMRDLGFEPRPLWKPLPLCYQHYSKIRVGAGNAHGKSRGVIYARRRHWIRVNRSSYKRKYHHIFNATRPVRGSSRGCMCQRRSRGYARSRLWIRVGRSTTGGVITAPLICSPHNLKNIQYHFG
jgi:hypothetical protein